MTTVIVSGSRTWSKPAMIDAVLTGLVHAYPPLTVIEGGAGGADTIAGNWARTFRASLADWRRTPALWDEHHPDWCPAWCDPGKRYCSGAGPRRNQVMLDELLVARSNGDPVLVVAFKEQFNHRMDKGGTEDMVRRALEATVPVYLVEMPALDG